MLEAVNTDEERDAPKEQRVRWMVKSWVMWVGRGDGVVRRLFQQNDANTCDRGRLITGVCVVSCASARQQSP